MREGLGLGNEKQSVGFHPLPQVCFSQQVIRVPAHHPIEFFIGLEFWTQVVFDAFLFGRHRALIHINPHYFLSVDFFPLQKFFPPPVSDSHVQHGRDGFGQMGFDERPPLRVFLPLNGAVVLLVIVRREGGHGNGKSRRGNPFYSNPSNPLNFSNQLSMNPLPTSESDTITVEPPSPPVGNSHPPPARHSSK